MLGWTDDTGPMLMLSKVVVSESLDHRTQGRDNVSPAYAVCSWLRCFSFQREQRGTFTSTLYSTTWPTGDLLAAYICPNS